MIGSILTKRYRDDADLDMNILFDVPEKDREEVRKELASKDLRNIKVNLYQVLNTQSTIMLLQIQN